MNLFKQIILTLPRQTVTNFQLVKHKSIKDDIQGAWSKLREKHESEYFLKKNREALKNLKKKVKEGYYARKSAREKRRELAKEEKARKAKEAEKKKK